MGLLEILGVKKGDGKHEELGELHRIVEEILGDQPEEKIKLVTGYAGVLGKVSYADMKMSQVELDRIEVLLKERLGLDGEDAARIVRVMDTDRVTLYSVEDHLYTRLLNDVLSHGEKLDLLTALFAVAAANDAISNLEDNTIRVISKGLLLSHKEFIDARLKYRDHLEVLM